MKIGFISTVLNEEASARSFLDSLLVQTIMPSEIIIVDGGSSDNTVENIKNYKKLFQKKKIKFELYIKNGNISSGRNYGIRKSTSELIAFSDFGCILEKDWLEKITLPFKHHNAEVVAGYYKGLATSNFQKCLVPYVLVMPDKLNEDFLPSGRSMAILKKTLLKVGGFSERLDYGEDYDLALKLKQSDVRIVLAKKAIVGWIPRSDVFSAFKMFYRYAYGDIKAGNFRPKVILILLRYLVFILLTIFLFFISTQILIVFIIFVVFIYFSWSILKNYKYIKDISAVIYLPIIQMISDLAIINGTILGRFNKIWVTQK